MARHDKKKSLVETAIHLNFVTSFNLFPASNCCFLFCFFLSFCIVSFQLGNLSPRQLVELLNSCPSCPVYPSPPAPAPRSFVAAGLAAQHCCSIGFAQEVDCHGWWQMMTFQEAEPRSNWESDSYPERVVGWTASFVYCFMEVNESVETRCSPRCPLKEVRALCHTQLLLCEEEGGRLCLGTDWEAQKEAGSTHWPGLSSSCLPEPGRLSEHVFPSGLQVLTWTWQALVIYILNLVQVCAANFWFSLWGRFWAYYEKAAWKPNDVSWCAIALSCFQMKKIWSSRNIELVLKFMAKEQAVLEKLENSEKFCLAEFHFSSMHWKEVSVI